MLVLCGQKRRNKKNKYYCIEMHTVALHTILILMEHLADLFLAHFFLPQRSLASMWYIHTLQKRIKKSSWRYYLRITWTIVPSLRKPYSAQSHRLKAYASIYTHTLQQERLTLQLPSSSHCTLMTTEAVQCAKLLHATLQTHMQRDPSGADGREATVCLCLQDIQ